MPDELQISRGSAFHRGDVVILRCTHPMTRKTLDRVREDLLPLKERHGIEFVLLDSTLEVVEAKRGEDTHAGS